MPTFSSWAELRTTLKDQIATLIEGQPFLQQYTIGSFSRTVRSVRELKELYQLTYDLESLDDHISSGIPCSYGRHRGEYR